MSAERTLHHLIPVLTVLACLSGFLATGALGKDGPTIDSDDAGARQRTSPTVPSPFICMYGHHNAVSKAFRAFIPPFTVIEGTGTEAAFVKELRAQGKVYAYHVVNAYGATTAALVAAWRAPFDNDLGGKLPGGYDAIAIDEMHPDADGGVPSARVCAALKQLRALYPDKLIFAAAKWQLGDGGPKTRYGKPEHSYADLLNALNDYTDIIMLEHYLREGNPNYKFFNTMADNIESFAPGILKKTVFGLYISQNGFVADDSTDRGLWGHLDEQFHRIRNDPEMAAMHGLMFWVYYRSVTDLTPDYCARLIDHYYTQGKTAYFGNGSTAQLITNPQFESNLSGWTSTPGAGGSITRFNYAGKGVRPYHDDHKLASHGASGLKTVRGGAGHNEARWQQAGIDTKMVYTASAYVIAASGKSKSAKVAITQSDGTPIAAKVIKNVKAGSWSRIIFNFTPTSNTINLVLSDQPASPGTVLYWDFVELEEAYPVPSSPPNKRATDTEIPSGRKTP